MYGLAGVYQKRYYAAVSDKRIEARFFRQGRSEPVRDWLKDELTAEQRKVVGTDIMTVEFTWPVGMPLVRPLGGGLHEVRSDMTEGTARVLFAVEGRCMVLLHGFMKKTRKTPTADLELARARHRAYKKSQREDEES
jgi:phage-related protein